MEGRAERDAGEAALRPEHAGSPEAVAFDLLPTAGHSLMERPLSDGSPEPSSATQNNRSKRRREWAPLKNNTPKALTRRRTPTPAESV